MTIQKWTAAIVVMAAIPLIALAQHSGALHLVMDNAGSTALSVRNIQVAFPRLQVNTAGQMEWGSGAAETDTNLYRSAADTLKTDDAFTVAGATLTAIAGVFTGDVSGDGGDQLFGFLQDQVASTTTSLTAAQCGKSIVSNSADVVTLPEASTVLGCRYTFISGTADDFDINPADATDHFGPCDVLEASAIDGGAGDEYRLTDIGTAMVIEATLADEWAVISHNGPITDVN